jgi:hypothetical protein
MSEETSVTITTEEPTIEQKLKWLNEWKEKVQQEISDYTAERDKVFAVYKKQKEMYDGWLNKKMKKIKKYDVVMNNRKKVLMDIDKEITNLSNTEN